MKPHYLVFNQQPEGFWRTPAASDPDRVLKLLERGGAALIAMCHRDISVELIERHLQELLEVAHENPRSRSSA